MAQMNDFDAAGLQDPPHDVDRGIMPVEQRCGRDETNAVLGFIDGGCVCSSSLNHCSSQPRSGFHSIIARTSFISTTWPTRHCTATTEPARGAVSAVSIFIDSIVSTVCFSLTFSPTATSIRRILPGIKARTSPDVAGTEWSPVWPF